MNLSLEKALPLNIDPGRSHEDPAGSQSPFIHCGRKCTSQVVMSWRDHPVYSNPLSNDGAAAPQATAEQFAATFDSPTRATAEVAAATAQEALLVQVYPPLSPTEKYLDHSSEAPSPLRAILPCNTSDVAQALTPFPGIYIGLRFSGFVL